MTLQQGSTGTGIKLLQRALLTLGYNIPATDGSFGTMTNEALIKFQKDHNLIPDGVAGNATFAVLEPLVPFIVDIYHLSLPINWQRVQAVQPRIQAFMVKAVQGEAEQDPALAENVAGALSIGAKAGLYIFLDFQATAAQHLANLASAIAGANIDMTKIFAIAIDAEDAAYSDPAKTAAANAFINANPHTCIQLIKDIITGLKATYPQQVWLYTYHAFLRDNLLSTVFDAVLWWSSVELSIPPTPAGYHGIGVWQFDTSMSVDGIGGMSDTELLLDPKLLNS
jgi:GH25 family lysozyme M1 (1,4-beta-N-acetylmuramidase)